jgi:hypothetical protein
MQNAFRMLKAKYLVKILLDEKRKNMVNSKYFKEDEARQTLGMGKPARVGDLPELKPKFSYKTGA